MKAFAVWIIVDSIRWQRIEITCFTDYTIVSIPPNPPQSLPPA